MTILQPVFKLFGRFLMWLYTGTGSYVLALVIFTILIKLVLFPFSIKSKKSMMKTQALQGKQAQLQKQYGKDKERYNQELQKLYQDEGVNPMSGCLWSLIPLPILWGVYAIVRRPLFYMYNLTADQLTAVQDAVEKVVGELSGKTSYIEIEIANLLNTNGDALNAAKDALGDASAKLSTTIDFNFLGINLSQTPKLKFWADGISWNSIGLILLPIILAVISFLSSLVSQRTNKINRNEENKVADATTRQMLIMMPLMYIWFGFIMPAGMCIYMMISCVLQMVQELIASRMLRSKFMEAQARREEEERLKKLEEKKKRQEKIEQRQREEEEAKKRRKRSNAAAAKKHADQAPKTDKGQIGIRRYALGRNYEPDRFGGVTAYRDPTDIVDEAAVEAALAKKKNRKKKPEEEAAENQVEAQAETLEETAVAEAAQEAAPEAAAPSPSEPEAPADGDEATSEPEV